MSVDEVVDVERRRGTLIDLTTANGKGTRSQEPREFSPGRSAPDPSNDVAKIAIGVTIRSGGPGIRATMNISLPDEMKAFVEPQMNRDGYASPSEFFRTLVREEQVRRARRDLEAKFVEALDSGPAWPMTAADWATLRQQAVDGLAGESIQP